MFGPEAPSLDWDSKREYARDKVQLYYLSHGATPLDRGQLTEALYGSWPAVAEEGPQVGCGWQGRSQTLGTPRAAACCVQGDGIKPAATHSTVACLPPLQRYGHKAAGWVRVRENWTMRDALSRPDHVIPGIPVFFVLAADTDFRERLLSGDMPLL